MANDNRQYKLKNPAYSCFCPLCSAGRQMKYRQNLSRQQYIQLILSSAFFTWVLYPLIGARAVFVFFMLWPTFEIINKILYRKELPCPHCGFDATWYRKDVKMARKKVSEFWDKRQTPEVIQS